MIEILNYTIEILDNMIDIYDNMVIDLCIDNKISIQDKLSIFKIIIPINDKLKQIKEGGDKSYE